MQASGVAWKAGHLDFTGAQMVLTLRLIAVAVRCMLRLWAQGPWHVQRCGPRVCNGWGG